MSKAKWATFQIRQNLSKLSSLSSKPNSKCSYLVPIISYGSEVWKPNKTELRGIEDAQKKATRWILNSSVMPYKQRLEKNAIVTFFTISRKTDDLLFFHKVANNNYDCYNYTHAMPCTKNSFETRQVSRNAFHTPELKKNKRAKTVSGTECLFW